MSTVSLTGGSCSSKLVGDINCDGKVDILDFNLLMVAWGDTGTGLAADIDHSGVVDLGDFNLLMVNWTN